MADTCERENDSRRSPYDLRQNDPAREHERGGERETLLQSWWGADALAPSVSMLAAPHLESRVNTPTRASLFRGLQSTHGNHAVQRAVHLYLQRSGASTATPGTVGAEEEAEDDELARHIERSAGQGQTLDPAARSVLETSLDADLSDVRVHTDQEADRLARSMQAMAFTSGQDIYFRSGAYKPGSHDGLRVLAHEATHAVQQSQGPVDGTPAEGGVLMSDPSDRFEQEAERSAEQMSRQLRNPGWPLRPSTLLGMAAGRSSAAKPVQRWQIGVEALGIDVTDPVHEGITDEALKRAGMVGPGGDYKSPEAFGYVRGARWNDDPYSQLLEPGKFKTSADSALDYMNTFDSKKAEAERRGAAGEKSFGPGDSTLARSHFGDLQFLHGMSSEKGEDPEATRKKMMMWAEFTTKVATGDIKGDTKFADLGKDMADIKKLFPDMKDQNISQFFGVKDPKVDVKDVAAGSLLHMVQDTYSSGHTERDPDTGKITSFNTYLGQDSDKHGADDQLTAGSKEDQERKKAQAELATQKSTELLKMIDKGRKGEKGGSWGDMQKYLNKDVLTMAKDTKPGGPGEAYDVGPDDHWYNHPWKSLKHLGMEKGIEYGHELGLGKAADAVSDAWDWTKEKAGEAWDWTKGAARSVGNAASDAWDWTKGAARTVGGAVSNAASEAWDWTKGAARSVGSAISEGASDAWDWTKGAARSVGNAASNVGHAVGNAASRAGHAVGNAVSSTARAVGNAASRAGHAVGNAVHAGASEAWDWTRGAARSVGNAASRAGHAVGSAISEGASEAWDWTKGAARSVGNAVHAGASDVWDRTKGVGRAVGNAASEAWDWTKGAGRAVGNAASNVGHAVGNAASNVGHAVGNAASSAWDWTKNAASSVGNAASSAWDWATGWL